MTQERNLFSNPAVILANGDFPSHPIAINYLENNKIIICTDGAADKLLGIGKKPDFIIGDFDSTKIKRVNRSGNWIEKPDQNKTDLEKAFDWCIKNNFKKIILLGAGGGREDHLFGNSFTLANYYDKVECEMITNYAKIICVKGRKYIKCVADQDISIIATEKIDSIH
jgi:thiamine pyrophosphokinase